MSATNVHDLLPRLQRWYLSQCDGDWEHAWGVRISTLDNPGWALDIDLESTDLAGRSFTPFKRGLDTAERSDDWVTCHVEDHHFKGFGGPETLEEIIGIFLHWAESP